MRPAAGSAPTRSSRASTGRRAGGCRSARCSARCSPRRSMRRPRRTGWSIRPSAGRFSRWATRTDFWSSPPDSDLAFNSASAGRWREIELDPERARVRIPLTGSLDLGATAKALAADRAAAAAATVAGGVLVSLGGDISVSGPPPHQGWSVRVTDDHRSPPDADGQTVAITRGGLATSSTTVRVWRRGDRTVHHIVDPATGAPPTSRLAHGQRGGRHLRRRERGVDSLYCRASLPWTGSSDARSPPASFARRAPSSQRADGRPTILRRARGDRHGRDEQRALVPGPWQGAVPLVLLTASLVLGITAHNGVGAPHVPRFAIAMLHRNLSLLVVVFLAVHISTSVLDPFAGISWSDAVVPLAARYRPVWLGLGAVAFDLLLALAITSLVRVRLGLRTWRAVHWLAYLCWPSRLSTGSARAPTFAHRGCTGWSGYASQRSPQPRGGVSQRRPASRRAGAGRPPVACCSHRYS